MYQDDNGHYHANVVMQSEELKNRIENCLEENPEMNISRLFRQGVRRELDQQQHNE